MAIGSGVRVDLSYVAEVTRGTTPGAPSMKKLRTTSRNINLQKNILQTSEVRQDRQKKDVRHGFNRIEGNPGFELSLQAYDDWLEALMGDTFAAVNVAAAPNLGATTTSTFTRAVGSFVTDGFRPGDMIVTTGFSNAANNGNFMVLTVAALSLTVLQTTLVTEASGAGKTLQLKGKRLSPGTALQTFTVERRFNDLAQYQVFTGVIPNTMNLDVKPEQMVSGNFGLIGMGGGGFSGTSLGVPSAAPTNAPLSSFEGTLVEGGTTLGVVTGVELQVENGRTLAPVVGSKYSPDVFDGEIIVTGRAMVFFQNATMFDKWKNETASSIYLRLDDINGTDFMHVVLPTLKYTGGNIDPPQTGPVSLDMPFQALVDNTTGMCMSIQRSNS
jgi:hypothetical protein